MIIFDCEGVLVDSEMIASQVLAEALAEQGLAIDAAACRRRYTGLSMAGVITAVEAELGRPLPADFTATLRARDVIAFERDLKPIAGVREVLAVLPDPLCVASSGSPEKIRHSLTLTGLIDRFDGHLFSAHQVEHGKPAPDLFLFTAQQMGIRPDQCLVIEDSVNGVAAAIAAGMTVWGFTGGGHWRDQNDRPLREAGAQRVFNQMADLPRMLDDALQERGK